MTVANRQDKSAPMANSENTLPISDIGTIWMRKPATAGRARPENRPAAFAMYIRASESPANPEIFDVFAVFFFNSPFLYRLAVSSRDSTEGLLIEGLFRSTAILSWTKTVQTMYRATLNKYALTWVSRSNSRAVKSKRPINGLSSPSLFSTYTSNSQILATSRDSSSSKQVSHRLCDGIQNCRLFRLNRIVNGFHIFRDF